MIKKANLSDYLFMLGLKLIYVSKRLADKRFDTGLAMSLVAATFVIIRPGNNYIFRGVLQPCRFQGVGTTCSFGVSKIIHHTYLLHVMPFKTTLIRLICKG